MPNWIKAKHVVASSPKYLKQSFSKKIPVVVVDVRDAKLANKSHVVGAVSIPLNQLAAAKAKFPVQKSAPIVIYADNTKAASKAFSIVRKWGYKKTSILAGGLSSYVKLKGAVASHKLAKAIVYIPKPVLGEISIDKFKAYASAKSSDVLILDARDAKEASKGMIKHALNIPTQDVINRLGEIPKNKLIVVHCKTGVRAEMAYQTLVEQGYNVKFLKAKIKIKSNGSFKITQS